MPIIESKFSHAMVGRMLQNSKTKISITFKDTNRIQQMISHSTLLITTTFKGRFHNQETKSHSTKYFTLKKQKSYSTITFKDFFFCQQLFFCQQFFFSVNNFFFCQQFFLSTTFFMSTTFLCQQLFYVNNFFLLSTNPMMLLGKLMYPLAIVMKALTFSRQKFWLSYFSRWRRIVLHVQKLELVSEKNLPSPRFPSSLSFRGHAPLFSSRPCQPQGI